MNVMKNSSLSNVQVLADLLFPIVEDEEIDILDIPANERKLRTETYDFSVATITDYMNNGSIIIPKFQREYVWGQNQASRLIESLIINCPIPVIYLSQGNDEVLSVIDGNQRLNSIYKYLNDEYELKGLSTFPDLDGLKFSDLDPRFQRHIKNRTLRCICILKDTHPQIKFDVFERLNTGSVKLNAQELRHGLYMGPLMKMIENLGDNSLFRTLTLTRNDKRMKSDELVLRFFAFSQNYKNYEKPMSNYLNMYCDNNKNIINEDLDSLRDLFTNTLISVNNLLGDKAFKTFDTSFKKPKFNSALFDAQMVALCELNLEESQILSLKKCNIEQLNYEFIASADFNKYISYATTDKNSVVNRITQYKDFIARLLK